MSGFESPNYTQTPNDFFVMLPDMSDAELRVTLVMIRLTFGFHREAFKMGVTKLADAAGLSRQGALDGAKAAEDRGTFRRTNPEAQTEAEWELVIKQVEDTLQPVEGVPPSSRGQVGVKESNKEDIKSSSNQKRGDIVDGLIDLTFKPKALRDAFAEFFRLTPNWEAKYNRQFLEWAVEIKMQPEQVRKAAELWRSDKRFNWTAPSLKLIQEHWLELTEEQKPNEKEMTRLL